MGEVVTIASEGVPDFIVREGGGAGMSTVVIGHRFGWDAREAYARLIEMERRGIVHRTGVGRLDAGHAQFWLPGPPVPGAEA